VIPPGLYPAPPPMVINFEARTGGTAQVLECLPSMCKVLVQSPVLPKQFFLKEKTVTLNLEDVMNTT
jgi:hypothetical protein